MASMIIICKSAFSNLRRVLNPTIDADKSTYNTNSHIMVLLDDACKFRDKQIVQQLLADTYIVRASK